MFLKRKFSAFIGLIFLCSCTSPYKKNTKSPQAVLKHSNISSLDSITTIKNAVFEEFIRSKYDQCDATLYSTEFLSTHKGKLSIK